MSHLDEIRERIKGPVFSVITPFTKKQEIDFGVLEKYLHYTYNAGGRIFYVMGYNSRFSQLSWEEIKVLNTFVARTVKSLGDDVTIIVADPLHCPTDVSVDFCRHAEAIGADMISLIFREKLYCNEQVASHFTQCANSCEIGILIHEMPFISGLGGHTVNWPVPLLDQLADIPNVIAIKEDAKNDEYSNEVISTISDRLSIIISGGGKRQWLQFADQGCQSWLNGIGVFEPKLAVAFWQAYRANDLATVQKIIDEIEIPFFEKGVDLFGWHLTIKAALEARGLMDRYERMPMMPLNENDYNTIRSLLESLPIDSF